MKRKWSVGVMALCMPIMVQAIVGGSNSNENFVVSVDASSFAEQSRCGGTIVNARWILTAAHCLIKSSSTQETSGSNSESFTKYEIVALKEVSIRSGILDLFQSQVEHIYDVSHVVIHPDYMPLQSTKQTEQGEELVSTAYQHDLALIRVKRDLPATPVTLINTTSYQEFLDDVAKWDDATRDENALVLGWGSDVPNAPSVDTPPPIPEVIPLKEADAALVPIAECFDMLEQPNTLPLYIASSADVTKLCTLPKQLIHIKNETYGHGACLGDSGGPLVWSDAAGNQFQVGIISASPLINTVCNSVTYPTWYTNVVTYLDWIRSYTDAVNPPTQQITKPTFMTSVTTETPSEGTQPSGQCNSNTSASVGGGEVALGCAESESSGSMGWLSLLSLLFLYSGRKNRLE